MGARECVNSFTCSNYDILYSYEALSTLSYFVLRQIIEMSHRPSESVLMLKSGTRKTAVNLVRTVRLKNRGTEARTGGRGHKEQGPGTRLRAGCRAGLGHGAGRARRSDDAQLLSRTPQGKRAGSGKSRSGSEHR